MPRCEPEVWAERFADSELREPMPVADYMRWLKETLEEEVHLNSPMMMGHMNTSLPDYVPELSKFITALNLNVVKTETALVATFLERQVLGLLHREVFGFKEDFYRQHQQRRTSCLGVLTCGGTTANIQALWMARRRAFPAAERTGLTAQAVVLASELAHYSLQKAVALLGLGSDALRRVPCRGFRVDLEAMQAELLRCRAQRLTVLAVVGLCGATETGSVDDLEGLAGLCDTFGCHFHVDAAWGGAMALLRPLRGIEKADTVTLDGHKLLFTPMGCGTLLLRDPMDACRVEQAANYIIREDSWDQGRFSLEGSRPANAIYLHMNLRCLSRVGMVCRLERSLALARSFAERLRRPGFELITDPPDMNIVLYRCVPRCFWPMKLTELNEAMDGLQVALQSQCCRQLEGFVSRTQVRCQGYGRVVCLRAVFGNLAVTEESMEKLLTEQRAWADDWGRPCEEPSKRLIGG